MTSGDQHDAFLSYAKADQADVEKIALFLQEQGLVVFFDRWNLVPGTPWQDEVEKALDASQTCVVFLGPSGLGPWDHLQMRAALSLRAERVDYRVIPVLLPKAAWPERGRLPLFLTEYAWIDFRDGSDDPRARHELVSGIKGVAPGPPLAPEAGVCPFRGLDVFEEEHAPFFFGRQALTQHLVEMVRQSPFLALTSPSGTGKSSLVRAGLIPEIRLGRIDGSQRWPILLFCPGSQPLHALSARLIPDSIEAEKKLAVQDTYLAALQEAEDGLHRIVQTRLSQAPDRCQFLVVVDQFEEVFTLCSDEQARSRFIDNLIYASAIAGGQTRVVLTLRADFFGWCAAYPALAARLSERSVLVGPLRPAELRQVIEEPARGVGLDYEKGLVDTIVGDLGTAAGNLPLLQYTLLALWQKRRGTWLTTNAYHELGGVQGALAGWADDVYDKLPAEQQVHAERVFLRLVQPGDGTEDTRRRALLSDLVPEGPAGSAVAATIQSLVRDRLLTMGSNERDEPVVDVIHEALIRHWPRLQTWLQDNRALLLLHRRLTDAAHEWQRRGREASYLYRGARLAEVEARLPWADLSPLEETFVQSSIDRREAEKRARRRRTLSQVGMGTLVLLLLIAVGIIAWQVRSPWQRVWAEDQAWTLAAASEPAPAYYVGAKDSGVWRSTDGTTWTMYQAGLPIGDGPAGRNIPAIFKVITNGRQPDHLYTIVARHGVYRSLDAGETWQAVGTELLPGDALIDIVAWGDLVLAVSGADDGRALYISRNGGQDWRLAGGQGQAPLGAVYAVLIDSRGEQVYVGAEMGLHQLAVPNTAVDPLPWQRVENLPEVLAIKSSRTLDETFYLVAGDPNEGVLGVYRWQPNGRGLELLTDQVPDQPDVLVPHPDQGSRVLVYMLLINNQVFGLTREGQLEALQGEPTGDAFDLLIGPRPGRDGLWLLLGHQQGLYEYRRELE